MCGICGIALRDPRRPASADTIRRMASAMQHRGPDGEGAFVAPGIGLGVRRLAIIDLETGDQPLSSEDGAITVVCNGEIYNYVELRRGLEAAGHRFRSRSDVEVIVHLYEDLDTGCLERLRGMYALALWDARRRRLLLARDRFGIKPLHYCLTADGLAFASEIKSLLATGLVAREPDRVALADVFTLGFVGEPRTLLAAVKRLPPGHYLEYEGAQPALAQYWDVRFPSEGDEGHEVADSEWPEALAAKLQEAVRLHLRSDVPVGSFLSAGIDSSTVAALMGRLAEAPVPTFSIAFEAARVNELRRRATLDHYPEYRLAGHTVRCRGADLQLLPQAVWHLEGPLTSGLEIPYWILASSARQEVKAVLTGEGADELLGGYSWYLLDSVLRRVAQFPLGPRQVRLVRSLAARSWAGAADIELAPQEMSLARFRGMIGLGRAEMLARLLAGDLRPRPGDGASDGDLKRPAGLASWHPFAQLQYYDLKVRLPGLILQFVDRMSMANSLEVRVPFLDHEVAELCARIPVRLKLKGLQEKYILRQAVRELLPPAIVRRKKRGLAAPCEEWMRGPLPEFAAALLSEGELRSRGYFDANEVQHLLARHRAGKGRYGHYLMGVLSTQLWDEMVLRGRGAGGLVSKGLWS